MKKVFDMRQSIRLKSAQPFVEEAYHIYNELLKWQVLQLLLLHRLHQH